MIGLVPENFQEAFVNQHVCSARPNSKYFAPYLAYYLASNKEGKEQFNNSKKGATKLGLGDIRNLEIPLPPLEEQQEIVKRVGTLFAQADALEAQYESLKAKVEKLPQALLAKAFRSELVP